MGNFLSKVQTLFGFGKTKPEIEYGYTIDEIVAREKAAATLANQPYVSVVSSSLENDLSSGTFTIEYNDIFLNNLKAAGFQGANNEAIVDQWFNLVCKNVVLETYENDEAMRDQGQGRFITRNRLEDGRLEFK